MDLIKLAIADDHKIFREGLKFTLEDYTQLDLIIEATNGKDLIAQITNNKPDVILMDIKMPEMDGMQAITYIRQHFSDVKILVLSMHNEDKYILNAMRLGASGYLSKNAEPEEILEAIVNVHTKGFYFNDDLSATMAKELLGINFMHRLQEKDARLNEREIEVLKLICEEYCNTEIADKLFLSVRTVEGYRTRLFEKVGSKNIAGLVIYAVKSGIITI
ncbi:response regulator transcription factor [Pedobacter sp. FW305-3-2-15-E-R2A2]|jgi:DNA-binding NarL/FixJ family response regulator|uniref:response regulator transcription factor n=1 Tax=Pedobacter sp. FW305-3-2-15-E-R2A2 TaxID=3140251 RepID=UPI00313FEECA